MSDLIVYTLAAFGFSWVLADSKISLPFREALARVKSPIAVWLLTLVECCACTGFHIGWIAYAFGVTPFPSWWMAAFYTCATNLLGAKLVGMLDDPH